jgi:hypothetical protein
MGPFSKGLSHLPSIGFIRGMPFLRRNKMKSCRNYLGSRRKAGVEVFYRTDARKIALFATAVF